MPPPPTRAGAAPGRPTAAASTATAPHPGAADCRCFRVCRCSAARATAAARIFFAATQYAGAFLLLPSALDWLRLARQCFADDYGSLQRGLLTSVLALAVGLPRMFHLDQMEDRGFALLTGGASRARRGIPSVRLAAPT